jgi:hypothetical protein
MISGLVLKDLNGECFIICGFYKYTLLASTEFNLTVPSFIQIAAKGFFEPTLPDFCIAANYCYEARGRKRTLSERDLSTDMDGRMTN